MGVSKPRLRSSRQTSSPLRPGRPTKEAHDLPGAKAQGAVAEQTQEEFPQVGRGVEENVGRASSRWFDSTDTELFNSGEGFTDINTVPWGKAARAATNICLGKQYSGGFFTGHQLNDLRGVVCLVP